MLATTPASSPNWCTPVSRRVAVPLAFGCQRHRREGVDHGGLTKHQRADRRSAPGDRVDRDHVGLDLVDVHQPVRRGRRMVDYHEPADIVHEFRHRAQIGDGAERRRRRRDRDQPSSFGDQALPLPARQITGLDVDFGPLDLRAVTVCCAQPRRDVCLVVEPGDHDLVAKAGPRGRRVGQRPQQNRAVSSEHHSARVGVHQIGRPPGVRPPARPHCAVRTGADPGRPAASRGKPSTRWSPPSRGSSMPTERRGVPNRRPTRGANRAPGQRRTPSKPPQSV